MSYLISMAEANRPSGGGARRNHFAHRPPRWGTYRKRPWPRPPRGVCSLVPGPAPAAPGSLPAESSVGAEQVGVSSGIDFAALFMPDQSASEGDSRSEWRRQSRNGGPGEGQREGRRLFPCLSGATTKTTSKVVQLDLRSSKLTSCSSSGMCESSIANWRTDSM